jgi:hypothetical protein
MDGGGWTFLSRRVAAMQVLIGVVIDVRPSALVSSSLPRLQQKFRQGRPRRIRPCTWGVGGCAWMGATGVVAGRSMEEGSLTKLLFRYTKRFFTYGWQWVICIFVGG